MKATIIGLLLMSTSLATYAAGNCAHPSNGAEALACSEKNLEKQTSRLMAKLEGLCEVEPEIWANRDGSMYRPLSNDCISKKLAAITKKLK